jgi:hypothetical protein
LWHHPGRLESIVAVLSKFQLSKGSAGVRVYRPNGVNRHRIHTEDGVERHEILVMNVDTARSSKGFRRLIPQAAARRRYRDTG